MALSPVIVSGYHFNLEQSALVVVDLEASTYQVLRPYTGPILSTPDAFYVARFQGAKTRIEKYDRNGLCWMKRVEDCVDTHSLALVGDELAVCSTGTNEIIFLDDGGTERRRWSPDPAAEPDSWHLNSLFGYDGRLVVSCFGRFPAFRGWGTDTNPSGLVLDVPTGEVLLRGLFRPHDPRRLPGEWIVNESEQKRLLRIPDGGTPEVITTVDGFPRGLAVLPDHYVLGVSAPRQPGWVCGNARLLIIDRASGKVARSLTLPFPEIGHVTAAPCTEVLDAIEREGRFPLPCMLPQREIVPAADRVGGITVQGPLRRLSDSPANYEAVVRVANHGKATWASENDIPVYLGFQIVNSRGGVLQPESPRTRLPFPLGPGRTITFPILMDLTICYHLPDAAAVRITLLQENITWWQADQGFSPAVVPLPTELVTPSTPEPTRRWFGRLQRA